MSSAACASSIPASKRCARLLADVDEVAAQVSQAGGVGHRPVSGHEHGSVELEDPVAGGDPVVVVGPDDRGSLVEQQVAGEDEVGVGDVDDRVAPGVGGTELHQTHGAVADREVQPAAERPRREAHGDVGHLERTEGPGDERTHVRGQLGLLDARAAAAATAQPISSAVASDE